MLNPHNYLYIFDFDIQRINEKKENVWFVFSGMGSQWQGMAKNLLHIDVFRESMENSSATLKPYDLDLLQLVTEGSEKLVNNTVNSIVGIIAIEVMPSEF